MKKNTEKLLVDVLGKSIPNASEAEKSDAEEIRRDAQLPTLIRADAEGIKVAHETINKIIDRLQGKSLIFRGESKDYGKIPSGLYRHYWELRKENQSLNKKNFSTFKEMMLNIDEVRNYFPEGASDLGMLTELQHHGGKTAFIDFTKDIHIALYFACNDHPNEDGRLFIFDKAGLGELDKNNFDKEREKEISDQEEIYWVNPVGSGIRVISQSSVFLCPKIGYLSAGKCKKEVIEKSLKAGILGFLDKFHGINEAAIYNDLQGFIKRDSNKYADFYRGYSLQNRSKYEEAIKYYDRMLEINPRFAEAYLDRGNSKAYLGNYEEAIKDYGKTLEINPKYAEACNNRGNANIALKQYDEAIKDYEKALKINPEDTLAYRNRGAAKIALGDYDEAIKDYEKALKINPNIADAYLSRGVAKAGSGKNEEAIKDYEKALEINPEYANACYSKGIAKAALGRYKEAIEDYDKALEINPDFALAYFNRGVAKAVVGEDEEAIKDYEKALEINPKYADAYRGKGISKFILGRCKAAVEDYSQALEINPKYVEVYIHRGNVKAALGKYEEVIEDYSRALKINPEHAEAYFKRGHVKAVLGRHTEAIEDVKQSLRLFQRQGNEERVRKAEELLRKIEGNLKNPPAGQ